MCGAAIPGLARDKDWLRRARCCWLSSICSKDPPGHGGNSRRKVSCNIHTGLVYLHATVIAQMRHPCYAQRSTPGCNEQSVVLVSQQCCGLLKHSHVVLGRRRNSYLHLTNRHRTWIATISSRSHGVDVSRSCCPVLATGPHLVVALIDG